MVSGKEFRQSLRRPMPGARTSKAPRVVPAFTIQSLQKGTVVQPPPECGVRKRRMPKTSTFKKYYKRGDFPISMEVDQSGYKISWKVIFFVI